MPDNFYGHKPDTTSDKFYGYKPAKSILNFSHPLSEKAKAQLVERLGAINEVIVPCQVNMDAPIWPQLEALLEAGYQALLHPDLIVPPALSFAAAYVGGKLMDDDGAGMIVLKRNDSVPPQFELAEIIYR